MSKPFPPDETTEQQKFIDDVKRFSHMFGSFAKLAEILGPVVSMKKAANEVQARLTELKGEEETLKAELDLKKAELNKAKEQHSEIIEARKIELTELAASIEGRKAELDRMLKARQDFLTSMEKMKG